MPSGEGWEILSARQRERSEIRPSGKRTFSWFRPQGQRPTEYELYTVGQMSSPQEWLRVGWPVRFDDGREPYVEESTKIRSSRWRDWRDPAGVWQRPYVQVANFDEQALDRLVPAIFSASELASVNLVWLHEVIGKYYAAWPFADYGLFLSLCYAIREALADTMRFALAFEATDKLRHQQDIVRLLIDLAELDPTFNDNHAREAWMSDPKLVPIRENIERIISLQDWAEIIVAIDLAFEPLAGALVKDEFLARNASHNGDPITPVILAGARRDTARHRAAALSFVRFLVTDPEFGADNRQVIGQWIARWAAESATAARAASGLFEIGDIVLTGAGSAALDRVVSAQSRLVHDLGID